MAPNPEIEADGGLPLNLQARFRRQILWEGSDFPDTFPVFTDAWRTAANVALSEAGCFEPSGVIAPLVTLRLTVEADARISEVALREAEAVAASPELEQCIGAALMNPALPPVAPATIAGEPVATYRVLLEMEVRFVQ